MPWILVNNGSATVGRFVTWDVTPLGTLYHGPFCVLTFGTLWDVLLLLCSALGRFVAASSRAQKRKNIIWNTKSMRLRIHLQNALAAFSHNVAPFTLSPTDRHNHRTQLYFLVFLAGGGGDRGVLEIST